MPGSWRRGARGRRARAAAAGVRAPARQRAASDRPGAPRGRGGVGQQPDRCRARRRLDALRRTGRRRNFSATWCCAAATRSASSANSAGKTTLLRLILGELQPSAGTVRRGTKLDGGVFRPAARARPGRDARRYDQPGSKWVEIGGARRQCDGATCRTSCSRRPAQLAAAHALRRRAQPPCCWRGCSRCRPTCSFWTSRPTTSTSTRSSFSRSCCRTTPARCSWSADRRFLDNVVTSTIAWEGEGVRACGAVRGGYEDWKLQRARSLAGRAESAAAAATPRAPRRPPAGPVAARPRKLSYKEQRRLDELPAHIDALEAEQRAGRAARGQRIYRSSGAARPGRGACPLCPDRGGTRGRARALGGAGGAG